MLDLVGNHIVGFPMRRLNYHCSQLQTLLYNYCFLGDAEGTAEDTIEFQLKVKCTRNPGVKESTDPDELYRDHKGLTLFNFIWS